MRANGMCKMARNDRKVLFMVAQHQAKKRRQNKMKKRCGKACINVIQRANIFTFRFIKSLDDAREKRSNEENPTDTH